MFTGLVGAVGVLRSVQRDARGLLLEVEVPWDDLVPGESVAVDGACLTVAERGPGRFTTRTVDTTLERTLFGQYQPGRRVNLERALRVGDRLGGHLVQGHVDGIGRVRQVTHRADAVLVDLEVPAEVADVSVPLGAITVDGVSLTIVGLPAPGQVRLSLIPYTLQETTLDRLEPGVETHVEGDVIGKYVAHLLALRVTRDP